MEWGVSARHFELKERKQKLTPYEFWIKSDESGKPLAFCNALLRGVTLSALLAMKRIGKLVFPAYGPANC
jgi:hypothetical protein